MICLRNNLPLVRLEDGDVVEFDHGWLGVALAEAALEAGHAKWQHTRDVVVSIALFLELDYDGTTVTHQQIAALIETAVSELGYGEIAPHFRLAAPPVRISLDDVARDAGHSYELRFFDILRTRLQQAATTSNEAIEIHNVRLGIKRLRRSKSWSAPCRRLLEEVIFLVRGAAQSLPHANIQIQM